MKKCLIGLLGVLVLLAGISGMLALTGCEDAEGFVLLLIEPSYVILTPGSNLVEFTISTNTALGDLALPLEWKTTQPHMGQILGAGGLRAIYIRFAPDGENTIIARDQYGNEGYATVRQQIEQYGLTLEIDPDPIPAGSRYVTIRVTGAEGSDDPSGRAPYTWDVIFDERGIIEAGQGTDTIVYRSFGATENIIQCTDILGVTGTILVQFTEEEDDD